MFFLLPRIASLCALNQRLNESLKNIERNHESMVGCVETALETETFSSSLLPEVLQFIEQMRLSCPEAGYNNVPNTQRLWDENLRFASVYGGYRTVGDVNKLLRAIIRFANGYRKQMTSDSERTIYG